MVKSMGCYKGELAGLINHAELFNVNTVTVYKNTLNTL